MMWVGYKDTTTRPVNIFNFEHWDVKYCVIFRFPNPWTKCKVDV